MTNQQIEQFRHDGFVLGNRVISDEQAQVLCQEVERAIRDREKPGIPQPVHCINMVRGGEGAIWQIVNIWQASQPFAELIRNPQIAADAAALLGASVLRLWHDQIQYKPAGRGGVNKWHQDSPYWPILQPKDRQITAWVALDDVDEANGAMSMVPGSHLWGVQIDELHKIKEFTQVPKEFAGTPVQVKVCPVRRGHVHFHHSLTWHGSNANTSDRPRRAIALHLMAGETRYDASGTHVMKPYVKVADGGVLAGEAFPVVFGK